MGRWTWLLAAVAVAVVGVSIGVGVYYGTKPDDTTADTVIIKPQDELPISICQSIDEEPTDAEILDFRLSGKVVPTAYDLILYPNMDGQESDNFAGFIDIAAEVKENTDKIILHSSTQVFEKIVVFVNGDETNFSPCMVYETNEFLILPGLDLQKGDSVQIKITYHGPLIGRGVGFFKTSYTAGDGRQQLIGSKHEPTYARKSYPCFDEPAMKVPHTFHVVYPKNTEFFPLSNTPPNGDPRDYDDVSMVQDFDVTPPMSTYLSCWVVSDFAYIEETSITGIPLRVYVTKAQKEQGQAQFALDILKGTFDYYENELFKIPYPLAKMDLIAIPDFVTGAMENWGLITFRESLLLYADGQSSAEDQEGVANTVSHELTHMWFGDLVTMEWWNNLWLNEGFATYFAPLGVHNALQGEERESWSIKDRVVETDIFNAMSIDDVPTTHAIINSADSADAITSVFDSITYDKGCSVIWSMIKVMGFDNFFNGITEYLKANEYGTVNELKLFEALKGSAPETLDWESYNESYLNYLRQAGYPLLTIADDGTVTQQQFFSDSSLSSDTKWTVSVGETDWLSKNEDSVKVTLAEKDPMNVEVRTFSRIMYSANRWTAIVAQLNSDFEYYDEITRTQFMDDALSMAQAGYIDYKSALEVLTYLKDERSYYVWMRFASKVSYLLSELSGEDLDNFCAILRPYVEPIATELGWDGSAGTHLDRKLRPYILTLQLKLNDPTAISNVEEMFRSWIDDNKEVDADFKVFVYKYGMRYSGSSADWEVILQRYAVEGLAAESKRLLEALANIQSVTKLNQLIRLAMYGEDPSNSGAVIRDQDVVSTMKYIAYGSDMGREMSWSWSRVHWQEFVDRYTTNDRTLGGMAPAIVSGYNTDEKLWEAQDFFDSTEGGAGEQYRADALEDIKTNIYWVANNLDSIREWISENMISENEL